MIRINSIESQWEIRNKIKGVMDIQHWLASRGRHVRCHACPNGDSRPKSEKGVPPLTLPHFEQYWQTSWTVTACISFNATERSVEHRLRSCGSMPAHKNFSPKTPTSYPFPTPSRLQLNERKKRLEMMGIEPTASCRHGEDAKQALYHWIVLIPIEQNRGAFPYTNLSYIPDGDLWLKYCCTNIWPYEISPGKSRKEAASAPLSEG